MISDDRRQMDRNTFAEVVNAFGHVPRDVTPKHGPHMLECLRCNERGVHVNGQMMPSLLEEKCFGQPIPREAFQVPPVDPAPRPDLGDGPEYEVAPADEQPPVDPNQEIAEAQLPPPEKDGTPRTRSTRRRPAGPVDEASLRV